MPPLYDYECEGTVEHPCTQTWEVAQRLEEPVMTHCPTCGQPTAKRVIVRTGGFVLRGGGWAADGYSSPGQGRSR